MEVFESRKIVALDSAKRLPLAPAERNRNAPPPAAVATRRPRRDVNARYKSPTPSSPSTTTAAGAARRFPSPNVSVARVLPSSSPKRALSAERRRPSPTPISPRTASTPVKDSAAVEAQATASARRLSTGGGGARLPESLWPSTMRSLSVSFQSDSISIPVSKKEKEKEKPIDRTLKPSSNVASPKHVESRKQQQQQTPERKRSPLRGRNSSSSQRDHQSENARPAAVDHSLRTTTKMIDQHRWPSRVSGRANSMSMNKSVDLSDIKSMRGLATPSVVPIGTSTLRKMQSLGLPDDDGGDTNVNVGRPLQKSSSDAATRMYSPEDEKEKPGMKAFDEVLEQLSRTEKLVSANLPDRMVYLPSVRTHSSLPSPRSSRPASPSKGLGSGVGSRGGSPCRTRPSTPPSSRGVSPSRGAVSSPLSSSSAFGSNSVLSFITDYKRGKRSASYIEDAHQLRLVHNRFLQWRFANAQQEAVLYVQNVNTETTLCDVWNTTQSLWDTVIRKRIDLQQQKLELKLNAILNDQMAYLDDWGLLERDHISSLTGAVDDLEASTLRLPVAGGAKADLEPLKLAVCSAVDVMQAMGSSICYLLSKAEAMNRFVTDLAIISAREKSMLAECEAVLASTAAMQIEEGSIRTHLIQMRQALENQAMLTTRTHQW
ncbi:unnamed protein product [Linum tenue]|uniref:AUGMIN subunit 8 n=1 Tax=Linum tenue TaxID=586396 RepID=A0AAV0L0H8_9ROSI|nr:unnamed protein product [Linum tenue]